ncbi:MAG TPA: nickel-responsive transcriptional regulator NikR, partial [Candidatus Tripitaka californicus]|uniref:nickel-responsive transcriptional regulator NikR n=1 Tax=Candidatus Tripitaka californicus TaxID=3367616 RepID=UPI00402865CD
MKDGNGLTRFGVSLSSKLLKDFDGLIARKGYTNRSEALRDLIRDSLVQAEWEAGDKETVGTVTLVYNHHTRELTHVLTDLQHHYHQTIISTTHIHLDEHNCLEVLVEKGKARDIKKLHDRLIGTNG